MSLKTRLALIISVLVTTPVVGGGIVAYKISRDHAVEQMKKEVDNLAKMSLAMCRTYYDATGADGPSPALRKALLSVRVGETGYPFALRSDGTTVLHPKLEGKNLKGAKDANGKPFLDEMIAMKDGWTEYWWKNPDEDSARKKISRVVYFEPWDWIIGVGSYEAEFLEGPSAIRSVSLTCSVVAILLSVGIGYAVARGIGEPVSQLNRAFSRLSEGDLTADVEIRRKDELGQLADAYREMRSGLAALIRQVYEASGTVAGQAQQISASSSTVAAGAEEQSQKATEVATAIEEAASTVIQVSRSAQEVAQGAQRMSEVARDGESVLSESLNRMEGIAQMVEGLADRIEGLGARSEAIGTVIQVINDIADQTNLLALNAAIEAARAGEHGRGFAVVADEVRKLAEKTTRATQEVERTIQAIQAESRQAVEATTEGKAGVDEARGVFQQAGQSFQAILEQVDQVGQMVDQIATATEQQSAAVEEMSGNVEGIATVSREVAEETAQLASAAESLADEGHELEQSVARFRLD